MGRFFHLVAAAAWAAQDGSDTDRYEHFCQAHLIGYLSEDGANHLWLGPAAEYAIEHRRDLMVAAWAKL